MSVHKRYWVPGPIRRWREISSLKKADRAAQERFRAAYAQAVARGLKGDDLIGATSAEYFEGVMISDQLDAIATEALIGRARRYGVPLPPRVEGQDWSQSRQAGTWSLTQEAAFKLRREIATELEVRQKPFLNWASLAVSGFSLAVSAAALAVSLGGVHASP